MPPRPRPLRVAVVDDYQIVVAGIATMLGEYADRVQVVELDPAVPVPPDVDIILFDAAALINSGLELSDLVTACGPKVVLFTWSADPRFVEIARDQGAAGYLSKGLTALELVEALEHVHAGEAGRDRGGVDLTAPEVEVLALVAQGMTNDQISSAVYRSITSVKADLRSAYRKIEVRSRSEAVRWALGHDFAIRPDGTVPPV